jgi:uncharacterized protein (DUF488 family)
MSQGANYNSSITIYTIGHSTLPVTELVRVLQSYEIKLVVDIRTVPRSRTNPQYNRNSLPQDIARNGLSYCHLAKLGGLRARSKETSQTSGCNNAGWKNQSFRNYADYALTEPFQQGLEELLKLASVTRAVIMCAEAVWWRCHRRIVGDYLLQREVVVLDLMPPAPPKPHQLTPFAQPQADGTICYPKPASA